MYYLIEYFIYQFILPTLLVINLTRRDYFHKQDPNNQSKSEVKFFVHTPQIQPRRNTDDLVIAARVDENVEERSGKQVVQLKDLTRAVTVEIHQEPEEQGRADDVPNVPNVKRINVKEYREETRHVEEMPDVVD